MAILLLRTCSSCYLFGRKDLFFYTNIRNCNCKDWIFTKFNKIAIADMGRRVKNFRHSCDSIFATNRVLWNNEFNCNLDCTMYVRKKNSEIEIHIMYIGKIAIYLRYVKLVWTSNWIRVVSFTSLQFESNICHLAFFIMLSRS